MNLKTIFFIFFISLISGSFIYVSPYNFSEDEKIKNNIFKEFFYKINLHNLNIISIFSCIFTKKCKAYNYLILKYIFIVLLNFVTYFIIILNFSLTIESILYCILSSILMFLSFVDIKYKIVPDKVYIIFLLLCFINIIFTKNINIFNRLYGSIIISLPLLIISIPTNGFGGGDIKLYFFLGFFLGFKKIVLSFFISIIIAGVFSVFLLIKYKNNYNRFIPFVPFIYIGTIISIIISK